MFTRNKLLAIAGLTVAASGAYTYGLYRLQGKLLYVRRKYEDPATKSYYDTLVSDYNRLMPESRIEKLEYELELADGSKTKQVARFLPARRNDGERKTLWVMFGGNAMLGLDWVEFCYRTFKFGDEIDQTNSFLLVDFPGYGDNGGNPSPSSILRSTMSAVDAVTKRDSFTSIGVVGWSLGCAAGLNFVKNSPWKIETCVLVSPFTSIKDIARRHGIVPSFLPETVFDYLIVDDCDWDNKRTLREMSKTNNLSKLFIIHGEQDEICDVSMGRELYKQATTELNANIPTRYIEQAGVDHNTILDVCFEDIFSSMKHDGAVAP